MIDKTIKYLKARQLHQKYVEFVKATEGMDEGTKNTFIDQHVMSMVHHLVHDAQHHANTHKEHLKQEEGHAKDADISYQKLHSIIEKLVNHFGKHEISDPTQVPHIQHLIENHPIIPKILQRIMKHEITVEEGVQEILESDNEPEHDEFDLKSSLYKKSLFLGTAVPMSVMNQYSSNALSAFRPSPPFLINTSPTPDEQFIKMIMKLKKKDNEPEIRPMIPADAAHETLAKEAKIVEGEIAGVDIKKSVMVLPYLERRLKMKHG